MPDMSAYFTPVDFILFGIIGFSVVVGLFRGFTREFFGALAWGGAVLLTFWGKHYLQGWVREWVGNPLIGDLLTSSGLFIISLSLLLSLTRALSVRVKASVLGGLDRSLGVVFGILRGTIFCVIAFLLTNIFWNPFNRPQVITQAWSYPFLLASTKFLSNLLPDKTIPDAFYHSRPLLKEGGEGGFPTVDMQTAEDLMQALTKPKISNEDTQKEKNKEEVASSYPQERLRDMDRLFKNYTRE